VITHPVYGAAVIRDQKPMSESKLRQCLDDLTPEEWFVLLNGKVFFWVSRDRLQRLLDAKAYRDRKHTVIQLQTRSLVERYLPDVHLCPINSGSTLFIPPRRGLQTFLPISEYALDPRKREPLVELAVDRGVPDVMEHVLTVEQWQGAT
jgi:hypothetical protein